ncbi:sporulation protein YqfD [Aquibacillus salsiterrae]|uniref:Sporulation protein YqfD n=1 Tax=Aquibacillus salsiterrae TaxID=2950439 RepID=A0A9X3WBE6_9BACI|nr:sporulation protein YqfD [Aquibacillus salsiterrae]MDC3415558.1 sporulation protein YqfD [Aquibacillus salsiterrae]
MKHTQGVFFSGYVTIKVHGHHPELFFDLCSRNGITVWNIKKTEAKTCIGNIKLEEIPQVKRLRRKTIFKVSFIHKKGLPFLSNKLFVHKPLIIGLVLSLFFVGFLSNIIWDVHVKGVHPEMEKQIEKQLSSYGIRPGAFKFKVQSPSKIQKQLLDDIPELLWVGVTEKGTTYQLEGVEKTLVEEGEKKYPRNLVATKEGVIVDMYVSRGQPMVEINDFVEKGDILVSGTLGEKEEEANSSPEEEKKDKKNELVSAEGEVIAKTWYKSNVNIPLKANYETLTGQYTNKYYLRSWGFSIPIWGFKNPGYEKTSTEIVDNPFRFLKWELPISFVKQTVYEKTEKFVDRTKQEAKSAAIKQAQKNLQSKLGNDAEIKFEKVLHEREENGKVKLTLYFTALENIAEIQPISQGD